MRYLVLVSVLAATAAALAVGSGGAAARTGSPARATTIGTASSSFGRIVVDDHGRTLYLFEKDTRGHSACAGSCAVYWPPLLTRGRPIAGRGIKQSLLGVTLRADGRSQVTYAGHPLYWYVADTRPGSTAGQDSHSFGAGWYVLSPAGTKIENDGS
jgi:predicted lipoprotein with Yx(FWY)xxD motif